MDLSVFTLFRLPLPAADLEGECKSEGRTQGRRGVTQVYPVVLVVLPGNQATAALGPVCCDISAFCLSSLLQGRCTNFALLKALCAQDSCSPRVSLPPSQECLPLASCSQCHQFPVSCSRFPSRLPSVTPPSWAPRARMSMYCTSQVPQSQD